MAVKYAKLGQIGTPFNSDILGIYLSRTNAIEIDEHLVENRLKAFFLTGFLVEITKVEYENIKLNISNARNIPLLIVPLSAQYAIEPVEVILSIPPTAVYKGNRFIIHSNPQGAWEGKKDYIVEFNGVDWTFIKPTNNLEVPIYQWGVSARYVGTYPSGKWIYDEELVENIQTIIPPDLSSNNFALQLFEAEQRARVQGDEALLTLIQNIQNTYGDLVAKNIAIEDVGGYYMSNNVELALAEVGITLGQMGLSINEIYQILSTLSGGAAGAGVNIETADPTVIITRDASINTAFISLDFNELATQLTPIINPPYLGNSDPENPTIIGVGGIPAGTVFDVNGIMSNDLWQRLLNPYTVPAVGIAIGGHYSTLEGWYNFRYGVAFAATLSWSITKKSKPVISGSISNVTDITPDLPDEENPITSGIRVGTAVPTVTPNGTGSFTIIAGDGDNNSAATAKYRFLKPFIHGSIDEADLGITDPAALYALLKTQGWTFVPKQNNTLAFNYTNKRMILAYASEHGALKSILDHNGFENLPSFTSRVANIQTDDQTHNYNISLRIYEGLLSNAVNGSWQFKF